MILYTYKRHFPESLDVNSFVRNRISWKHRSARFTACDYECGFDVLWLMLRVICLALPRLFQDGRNLPREVDINSFSTQ